MNLPKLTPPPMPPEERLRRLRLQKLGLSSWDQNDGGTRLMYAWVEGEIYKAEQAIRHARAMRN